MTNVDILTVIIILLTHWPWKKLLLVLVKVEFVSRLIHYEMIYNILLNNVLRNNVRLFQFHSRGEIKSAAGSAHIDRAPKLPSRDPVGAEIFFGSKQTQTLPKKSKAQSMI